MSEFVVIAGLSGAGRSTASATFEDLGWFVIDNLPVALIGKVAELVERPGSETERIALVVGRAGAGSIADLHPELDALRGMGARVRVLFLEANDDILVRRYEANRRRHPTTAEGVAGSVAQERALLQPLRERADVIVDTTNLNVHQLRERLVDLFTRDHPSVPMQISVLSFGFKNGMPRDVDTVLDCRFLPNPHWVDELRPFTGLDGPVRDYVLEQPESKDFLARLDGLLELLLPAYVKEGKSYLTIAVGCTGGQHRSVVMAEEIGKLISARGYPPIVSHRDVPR